MEEKEINDVEPSAEPQQRDASEEQQEGKHEEQQRKEEVSRQEEEPSKQPKEPPEEQQQEEEKEQEDSEKHELKQDLPLIIGLVVIVLVFGIILYNSGPKPPVPQTEIVTYNGYTFENVEGIWYTDMVIQDTGKNWTRTYNFMFHFNPFEVEDIYSNVSVRGIINKRKIYVTTDPDYPAEVVLGGVEVAKIISQVYERPVQAAVTRNETAEFPVVTCDNVTSVTGVIDLRLGDATRVYTHNGCIIVEGQTPADVVRASEHLSFEMLKIL